MGPLGSSESRLKSKSEILKDFDRICDDCSESFRVLNGLFRTGEEMLQGLKPPVSDMENKGKFQRKAELWRAQDVDWVDAPLLRSGLFLALYANVEDLLTRFCRCIEKCGGFVDSQVLANQSELLNGYRGSGIVRAGTFLTNVVEVNMPVSFDAVIPLLHTIRNALVHQNGALKPNELIDLRIIEGALQKKLGELSTDKLFMDVILNYSRTLTKKYVIRQSSGEVSRIVLLPQFNSDASVIFQLMLQSVINQLEEKLLKLE